MRRERRIPEFSNLYFGFGGATDKLERNVMSSVKDLIKAGLVQVGDELVWKRRVQGVSHSAIINSDGTIKTSDGKLHRTPSGAAKHLNSNKPVDGWLAWRLRQSNSSLAELRKRLS
jgi:hypothetical protein